MHTQKSKANLQKTTVNHDLYPTVRNVHLHGAHCVQHHEGELLQDSGFYELIQVFKYDHALKYISILYFGLTFMTTEASFYNTFTTDAWWPDKYLITEGGLCLFIVSIHCKHISDLKNIMFVLEQVLMLMLIRCRWVQDILKLCQLSHLQPHETAVFGPCTFWSLCTWEVQMMLST